MGKRKRYSNRIFCDADFVSDEHFLYVEVDMVSVLYVDGDEEIFETKNSIHAPWRYITEEQSYLIPSIEGHVVIPAGFIKRLKHIEVEE